MSIAQMVAAGGPLFILVVVTVDLVSIAMKRPTPGQVVQWWSADHPILAALFAGFVGAFAAHIFWHT
jgi:hypothetical protein